jgi:hypothetical protein
MKRRRKVITVIYTCSLDVLPPLTQDRVLEFAAVLECQEMKGKGSSCISETHNTHENIASEFTNDRKKICLKTRNRFSANSFFLLFTQVAGIRKRNFRLPYFIIAVLVP